MAFRQENMIRKVSSGALVRRGIGFFAEYHSGITLSPEVAMKQITGKEYKAYLQYRTDRLHGRILIRNEGFFDIVVGDE